MRDLLELVMEMLARWACPAGVVAAAFRRGTEVSDLRFTFEHCATAASW